MLYKFFGSVNSGKTTCALDRVVNSKYDNVLVLLTDNLPKNMLNRLKAYEQNTKKIIINKIVFKSIRYDISDVELNIILDEAIGKYDCILIDNVNLMNFPYNSVMEALNYNLAEFSKKNDIDILTVNQFKRFDGTFDEAMAEFEKINLLDDQENILIYRSFLDDITFIKIYERRNNLIRSFKIDQYFFKKDDQPIQNI